MTDPPGEATAGVGAGVGDGVGGATGAADAGAGDAGADDAGADDAGADDAGADDAIADAGDASVGASDAGAGEGVGGATRPGGRLRTILVTVIAVTLLVLTTTTGFLWGRHDDSSPSSASAVDKGFARDMSTHHQQAITMATYTRDNTTNTAVKAVAYDIESSQSVELGEMTGWLVQWGASRNTNSPMSWMSGHADVGTNGLMPGMATPSQMTKLQTLRGTALDIFFLQLMIRHHQGGIAMASYAARHASEPYVRDLAQNMYDNQTSQIVQMEQMLRELGGSPLAPPSD